METGISTHAFAHDRLSSDIIGKIADAGFNAVELYAHKPHFQFDTPKEIESVSRALEYAKISVNSIHCPFYRQIEEARKGKWLNISSSDSELRKESISWIKKSIEIAEFMPFDYAVIHFGDINDTESDRGKLENALESLQEIIEHAANFSVLPVLENIPNGMATCTHLYNFISTNKLENMVGICFDTGHAAMAQEIETGIPLLGTLIKTVHLHDTINFKDEHLPPGEGVLDWMKILSSLKSTGYGGRLMLENKWGRNIAETILTAAESAKKLQIIWQKA